MTVVDATMASREFARFTCHGLCSWSNDRLSPQDFRVNQRGRAPTGSHPEQYSRPGTPAINGAPTVPSSLTPDPIEPTPPYRGPESSDKPAWVCTSLLPG